MKASTPIRIDAELYISASQVASLMSRSTAQQIAHWARIGREIEADAEISVEDIARVLRGKMSYDDLGAEEQAVVRAFWAERMKTLTDDLRLDQEFTARGQAYVELDENGEIVRHDPKA